MVCQINIFNEKKYPLTEFKIKKITQLVEKNTDLDQNKEWVLNLFLINEKESNWLKME